MFYSRFPTYRVVFMQKLPISHVCLSPVYLVKHSCEIDVKCDKMKYVVNLYTVELWIKI